MSIRNGLAHGNEDIISKINHNTLIELKSFLLDAPDSILERIIKISKRVNTNNEI